MSTVPLLIVKKKSHKPIGERDAAIVAANPNLLYVASPYQPITPCDNVARVFEEK